MTKATPPVRVRMLAVVVALGLVGWGVWDRMASTGAAPVERALRDSDPTIADAVIHLTEGPYFVDAEGYQRPRNTLWCGRIEGRAEGRVAVLTHHSRRRTSVSIQEIAFAASPSLTDSGRWLLSKCDGVGA